jgi:hypothetical protein
MATGSETLIDGIVFAIDGNYASARAARRLL